MLSPQLGVSQNKAHRDRTHLEAQLAPTSLSSLVSIFDRLIRTTRPCRPASVTTHILFPVEIDNERGMIGCRVEQMECRSVDVSAIHKGNNADGYAVTRPNVVLTGG
jgi:hypothetical protein